LTFVATGNSFPLRHPVHFGCPQPQDGLTICAFTVEEFGWQKTPAIKAKQIAANNLV
jgi:hypothetical protein